MFLGMVVVVILTSTFATVAVIVIVIFIVLHLRKTPKAAENPEATMEGATIEAKRIMRYECTMELSVPPRVHPAPSRGYAWSSSTVNIFNLLWPRLVQCKMFYDSI